MAFALVDCESFYASCERIFRPDLKNIPIDNVFKFFVICLIYVFFIPLRWRNKQLKFSLAVQPHAATERPFGLKKHWGRLSPLTDKKGKSFKQKKYI